jgi:hypothetical protein
MKSFLNDRNKLSKGVEMSNGKNAFVSLLGGIGLIVLVVGLFTDYYSFGYGIIGAVVIWVFTGVLKSLWGIGDIGEHGHRDARIMQMPGFALRVSLSIVVAIAWLIFVVLWLFFYAADFSIFQNLAILLVSVLLLGAVLGPAWASWGIKQGMKYEKEYRQPKRTVRKARRAVRKPRRRR